MSKYEEQNSGEYHICPYCKAKSDPGDETINYYRAKEFCRRCYKSYWISATHISVYETEPNCKLYSNAHNYVDRKCTVCGLME